MLAALIWIDWTIIVGYIAAVSLVGLLCRKYIHNLADFVVAGRSLGLFVGIASLASSEMGLVTVLYWGELGYKNGFSAFIVGIISAAAALFVGVTGYLVKGLRDAGVMTVAEYYELRYSRGVHLLGGLLIAVAGILNMGVFLKAGAIFLRCAADIPEMYHGYRVIDFIMTGLLLLVLAYTLLGGMVSVIITDYLQFFVMTVGLAWTTYAVLAHDAVGGLDGIIDAIHQHRQIDGQLYGMNPFVRIINDTGAVFGFGAVWCLWQAMLEFNISTWQTKALRTTAADSPRTATLMWGFCSMNFLGRAIIPMLWGTAAIAYFATSGNATEVSSAEAMPTMIGQVLSPGLLGLLIASMLAAFMSTHDTYLLSWATVLAQDVVAPLFAFRGKQLSDLQRIWLIRVFIVLIGLFLLIWGLWYEIQSTFWEYLALTGTAYVSGAAAVLGGGLYWKRANAAGAYCALITGFIPAAINLINDDWLSIGVAGFISFPLAATAMVIGSLIGSPIGPAPRPSQGGAT